MKIGLNKLYRKVNIMSLSIYADSLPHCYFEEFCYGTICVSPALCRKSKSELTDTEKFRINQIRRNAGHDPIDFTESKVDENHSEENR